ncbi:hypothetical protein RQP46_011267 [Phenoliferia psychrophenolica]
MLTPVLAILSTTVLAAAGNQAPVYSCENTTTIQNTCCSPTPGALVLATQYWNTYTGLESSGQFLPENSWTIHGLWPDFCDGSYTQYCDLSRQYDPSPSPNTTNGLANGTVVPAWKGETMTDLLKRFGRRDLLSYISGFWVGRGSSSDSLWAHEFSKHATCTSTFDVACYADYAQGMEVVDYFQASIRAFKNYPSFSILAAAGVVPSNTTTYTLAALQSAFVSQTGAVPYFGCQGPAGNKTILGEIWVHAHVLGTPQYGQYKAINTTARSNCAAEGINYYEPTPGSVVSKYL